MDIELFVRNAGSRLRRYRLLYRGLDWALAILFLFAAAMFMNLGALFRLIGPLEPYVGLSASVGPLSFRYDTIGLFILCAPTGVLLVKILPQIRALFSRRAAVRLFKMAVGGSDAMKATIRERRYRRRAHARRDGEKRPSVIKRLFGKKHGTVPPAGVSPAAAVLLKKEADRSSRKNQSPARRGAARDEASARIDDAIRLIEVKNPSLKHRLRTAYDNARADTLISQDLVSEVSAEVDAVPLSCMMNKKKVRMDIFAIVLIFLAAVGLSAAGIDSPVDADDIVRNFQYGSPARPGLNQAAPAPGDDSGTTSDSDSGGDFITGPPTISQARGAAVNVSLPPGSGIGPGSELDSDKAAEIFDPSTNYDPTSIAAGHYTDSLPEGYESLVRQYFEKMTESR